MNSRLIAIAHFTALFLYVFAVSALLFAELVGIEGWTINSPWLALSPAVIVIGSWWLFGGCIFTKLENWYREKELPGSSYGGIFTDYYVRRYVGIQIPRRVNQIALSILLAAPLAIALL